MPLSPIPMSAGEVRSTLQLMAHLAGNRASFDGSLEYHAWGGPPCTLCAGLAETEEGVDCDHCNSTGEEPLPEGMDYWVNGVIRDNSDGGQGFMKMIGRITDSTGQPLSDMHAL
jgi:hypothetical protein